jgi:3-phenylpropionate/trans-cinnamate dioxygenase ferredoxin subunit
VNLSREGDRHGHAFTFGAPPLDAMVPKPVGGVSVLVVNYQGQCYALRNNCTHKDFPLLGGDVSDGKITCEKHGGKFELTTGKARALPAVKAVKIYKTEVEDGAVYVSEL